MFAKIWQRYFIKQLLLIFFLFIICFYGLYILIDYSSKGNVYRAFHFSYWDLICYYLYLFVQRLDILIPFAFMIACVRTLCQLNTRNELIALMASGIKLKTLLRPFLLFALLLTAILYLNYQVVLPFAWKSLKQLEDIHFEEKYKSEQKEGVKHLLLSDNTALLFHSFDSSQEVFHDVFWIRSIDDIFHMKALFPYREKPEGLFVDHFVRKGKGKLLLQESHEGLFFPDMHFNIQTLSDSLALPHEQSLTQLWKKLPPRGGEYTDREAQILTAFYYKMAMPWLCLLVFIGPAPSCLRFSRQLPIFFIYLCSMFGTVAFYLIMNTAMVMGENQVVAPFWAIWTPFTLFLVVLGLRYVKLR